MSSPALIPGLPNELALEVLLRVSGSCHVGAVEASKLWKIVLCSDRFYVERLRRSPYASLLLVSIPGDSDDLELRHVDLAQTASPLVDTAIRVRIHTDFGPILALAALDPTFLLVLFSGGWKTFDLLSRHWTPFGPPPSFPRLRSLEFLGLLGSYLFLMDYYSAQILSYDMCNRRWHRHEELPAFKDASLSSEGYLFLAFQHDAYAYALNPTTNRWQPRADMSQRLLSLSWSWSCVRNKVVSTANGALICAVESSFRLSVAYQMSRASEWRTFLDFVRPGGARGKWTFKLRSNGMNAVLIVKDTDKDFKGGWGEHHFAGIVLKCLFVHESVSEALLINV